MERSHSGLVRGSGEAVGPKGPRGFESHPLRQSFNHVIISDRRECGNLS